MCSFFSGTKVQIIILSVNKTGVKSEKRKVKKYRTISRQRQSKSLLYQYFSSFVSHFSLTYLSELGNNFVPLQQKSKIE